MRIVAGRFGGRVIQEPHGHKTHPMSEKIRGALFNALGDVEGLSVLDAFSGSGALAVEAVSRGATTVQAVDSDKEAAKCILKNIRQLNLEKEIRFSQANITSWLDTNQAKEFDIVLLDPPFDQVKPAILDKVVLAAKSSGVIVLSLPKDSDYRISNENFSCLSEKLYGDAKLVFYRRLS